MTQCDGKSWYVRLYEEDAQREIHAAALTASERANSVRVLLRRNRLSVESVADLGCGPGEVIAALRELGVGRTFLGVDASPEAISWISARMPDVVAWAEDITSHEFRLPQSVDLLLITHVLEHLERPLEFLCNCSNHLHFQYAVIEVPLEGMAVYRLKTRMLGRNNHFGHVQFFTRSAFRELVESAGLRIVDELLYSPVLSSEGLSFIRRTESPGLFVQCFQRITRRWAPLLLGPVWARFYLAHYAVLCTKT